MEDRHLGFTGFIVVARSDGPLEQVPMLASVVGPHAPEAAVDPAWRTTTGWQAVEVTTGRWFPDRPKPLSELVRWTGAPVSVARVVDSDCAIVTGLAPGGRPWRTALHIDSVADYAEHEPEALLLPEGMKPEEYGTRYRAHVPHAARDLVAWAVAAGFPATDPTVIRELLLTESVFVEETWHDVLAELGFPTP